MNLASVRELCRVLDANPVLGLDARELAVYPLLDNCFSHGERLQVELDSGLKLSFEYRSKIAKEILLREREFPSHVWEPMTTRVVELVVRHFRNRSGSVLVGGAYIGDHALVAAHEMKALGVAGKVICVEPDPASRKILSENAKVNNLLDIVHIEDAVLWSEAGLQFTLSDGDSHATANVSQAGDLNSRTIDEVTANHHIDDLALIMLDIEGAEEQALRGAPKALGAPKSAAPIVISEIHRNYVDWSCGLAETPVVKLLERHGYTIFALRDVQGNWELDNNRVELIPLDAVLLDGPAHGFNLVAAKDLGFLTMPTFALFMT